MPRAPLADEIAAARAICRGLGLGEVAPVLVKAAHHTTLLIASLGMVARVQSSEALDLARERAVRELAVARHLAARGAPALAPLEGERAGPHAAASAIVTLWPYLEGARVAGDADAPLAAATLASVHRGLRDYGGALPRFTLTLDRCWRVLRGGGLSAALSGDDRDLLTTHFRRLRDTVEAAAAEWVPLHGDAHLGNLLLSDRGALWTDFEDACLGPRELDIAGLPSTAWPRFADADQALVARCADLKSVSVAIWCCADIARSAEVREAADYHLDRVRGFVP